MDPTDALPCGLRGHDLGQAPAIERTVSSLMDGAIWVSAYGACTSCTFAVDDDCGSGRFAGLHSFGVLVPILGVGNFGVFVVRERSGPPFLRVAMRRLDLY
jgi:hypothetical protein